MSWWYGISFSAFSLTMIWALSAKYLTTNRQVFWSQIALIPFIFLVNFWYSKSVILASKQHVSLFTVTIFGVALNAVISFLLGWWILNQQPGLFQWMGAVVVVIGVILLNLK